MTENTKAALSQIRGLLAIASNRFSKDEYEEFLDELSCEVESRTDALEDDGAQ